MLVASLISCGSQMFPFPTFLFLGRVHIEDLIRTALWCDIISHSFNSRRAASATAWPCSSSRDALRARLRVVLPAFRVRGEPLRAHSLFPDVFFVFSLTRTFVSRLTSLGAFLLFPLLLCCRFRFVSWLASPHRDPVTLGGVTGNPCVGGLVSVFLSAVVVLSPVCSLFLVCLLLFRSCLFVASSASC